MTLIERLEAATGADRELDAAIFHAIGAPAPFQFANKLIALEYNDVEQAYFARVSDDMQVRYSPPAYTASIDAALTLVPEGMRRRTVVMENGKAGVQLWWPDEDLPESMGKAYVNEPIATVIAALKAQEAN